MGLWCRARDALESPLLYATVKREQALESETAAGKISNLNLIAILWGIFKWPTIIFIPVLYSIACLRMWDKAPIKLLWLHFQVHQWGNECDWCAQYDCGARIIHVGKKTWNAEAWSLNDGFSIWKVLPFNVACDCCLSVILENMSLRHLPHWIVLNLYILRFSNADPEKNSFCNTRLNSSHPAMLTHRISPFCHASSTNLPSLLC